MAGLCLATTFVSAQTRTDNKPLMLHYDQPAKFFEEALVIGNGSMGGIVYGGTETDRISLNDITLWTGEPANTAELGDRDENIQTLKEIRAALNNEDYRTADHLQLHLQTVNSQQYQPLGTLTLEYTDSSSAVSDYQRTLDISNAIATTEYSRGSNHFTAHYFCSAPDSVMVIHLKSSGAFSVNIGLDSPLPHSITTEGNEIMSDGYAPYNNNHDYDSERGIHFRTIVKVMADNRHSISDGRICLKGVRDVKILIANVTSFNGADKDPVRQGRDYKTLVRRRIDSAAKAPVFELTARHTADYRQFFDRVRLDLGQTDEKISTLPTDRQLLDYTLQGEKNPELEALYFQYGRYLLISCSRTHEVPANLQGLWNESLTPPWSCNYTANINLEENYWAAETTNLSELHMPMLSFLKKVVKNGEKVADIMYGVDKGWSMGHNSDIWAKASPVGSHRESPSWSNWNMAGAWTSTHIWEHFQFTRDMDFLREYYPVLKGAAEFCMGWLTEKDGKLLTSPATSPENIYLTNEGYEGTTIYGGFADIAMIRECLIDTREAAKTLDTDSELQLNINKVLSQMQEYKVGRKGNLQEWFHDWEDKDPQHRHQSHLFGLYPGHHTESVDCKKCAREYLDACAKTLEIKGDRTTGWSTGWRVNLYARLGMAKEAYHIYRKLLNYISPDKYQGADARRGGGTYPNLLDAHSPFQIDGNFGGCAGVAEMLVQSAADGTITLLPALPEQWKDGAVEGLCTRGGAVVSMTWKDGKVTDLSLKSRTGKAFRQTVVYNEKKHKIKIKP